MYQFFGFSGNQDNLVVTKKALLMVEGQLNDSKGRPAEFTPERLQRIADNSNSLLERGGRIPIVVEHNKTASAEIGEVCPKEGKFYVVVIQEEHLPNPKAKELIGKTGLYVSNLRILDEDFVKKISKGLSRSVSMGLDLKTETIREISLVGIPAFDQALLFSKDSTAVANFSSLTWSDDIETGELIDRLKVEYEKLSQKCWTYLVNTLNAGPETLKGRDPVSLADETLYGFAMKVKNLMGFVQENQEAAYDPTANNPQQPQAQGGQPGGNPNQAPSQPAQAPQAAGTFSNGSLMSYYSKRKRYLYTPTRKTYGR